MFQNGTLKSFFHLKHQVDITLHRPKAIALCRFEDDMFDTSYYIFTLISLFGFLDFKVDFISCNNCFHRHFAWRLQGFLDLVWWLRGRLHRPHLASSVSISGCNSVKSGWANIYFSTYSPTISHIEPNGKFGVIGAWVVKLGGGSSNLASVCMVFLFGGWHLLFLHLT